MITKNKYGQYFTPKYMADFMVSLLSCNKEGDILEPSSGEGVFLSALEQQDYHNWTAYEIDSSIITHPDVICHSFVTAEITKTFDAVIGNPPYIRWKNLEKNLKEELLSSELWNNNFNALCDYLFFFIAKSIELLKPGGELIFICSDYWLNSTNGYSLRSYLTQHGEIDSIYLFREAQVFSGVTASLMVFKFCKQFTGKDISLYTYQGNKKVHDNDLYSSDSFKLQYIPQFTAKKRWILAPLDQQVFLQKIENACSLCDSLFQEERSVQRIGNYFDIGNGLVSGLDKAFNISHLAQTLSKSEKEYTLRVVKAKDIVPYKFIQTSTYIYIEDKEITEQTLRDSFPLFYSHLEPYKIQLSQRYQYGREIDYWSFSFPRNKKLFDSSSQRILVPCKDRISKRKTFRFCLADADIIPLQDVTGLLPKTQCKESIEYVLAYLNSPPVFQWLTLNGVVKGEVVEFSEAPLANIPYRTIKWDNPQEVEIHNDITFLLKDSLEKKTAIPLEQINKLITSLLKCD